MCCNYFDFPMLCNIVLYYAILCLVVFYLNSFCRIIIFYSTNKPDGSNIIEALVSCNLLYCSTSALFRFIFSPTAS
jgi:hypothetical protein